ncbi:MAG: uracil-DNA glycosylase [Gemmatimonadota bacterium]|nr:MAG: uracil-DNA glycosylase [Gemmatimonadota bacterium]
MKLTDVRDHLGDCHRCALSESRTTLVFGAGNPKADIVLVGEAPGAKEDSDGVPFVGAAGKLLDSMLARISLDRSGIYIANVLKCRPPSNRDPKPDEIETCVPFLFDQLDAIQPRVVGTLGNFSTRVLLGTREGITALRGQVFNVRGWTVLPMYHPAAALHNGSLRPEIERDFLRLQEFANPDRSSA